jgi:hypothetical protein
MSFNENHKRVRCLLPKIHFLVEQVKAAVGTFLRTG